MSDRFYIPLTSDQEKTVRNRASKRIGEYWKRSSEEFFENLIGLDERTGRERIAFYRSTSQPFWDRLSETRPDRARILGRDWMILRRKYPLPPMLQVPIGP